MVLAVLVISLEKNSNKGEKKKKTTFDLVSDSMKFLWVCGALSEPYYCFVFTFLTVLP